MALSLSTISSVFSPSTSALGSGQYFLNSLGGTDPITDGTLAVGQLFSHALGNAQINLTQGTSSLAANAAITRINNALAAKQSSQSTVEAALGALLGKTVDKKA